MGRDPAGPTWNSAGLAWWFERLDSQAAAKVTTAMTRLSLGNIWNVKWFEGIGEWSWH